MTIQENKNDVREDAFISFDIDDTVDRVALFGNLDINLNLISEAAGVQIVQRDNSLLIRGEKPGLAIEMLKELIDIMHGGEFLDEQKVNYVIQLKAEGGSYSESGVGKDVVCFTAKGKPLKAKTVGQKRYVNAVRKSDMVFGIGPAGTGKTYLAVALAVSAYKNKEVEKIILTRPAVEAGEKLGFLPGDLQDKVDPYLRPIYDALYDLLGRDNAFIILDEAQNTTCEQMKMFLTRMGFGSKIVVTGDVTQIDLPSGKRSGLVDAERVLKGVKGIEFCYLREMDVVRHEMVKRVISAYDKYYKHKPKRDEK